MDAMSQDDVITSGLGTVNFGLAGHFKLADGATSEAHAADQLEHRGRALPAGASNSCPTRASS